MKLPHVHMFAVTALLAAIGLSGCGGGGSSGPAPCPAGLGALCPFIGSTVGVSPVTLAPATISVQDCTTNIPFIFKGGNPPYTVFSNGAAVRVGSPLPLGSDYYFLASVDTVKGTRGAGATLTVLDSQSRIATSSVTTASATLAGCPANPLLEVVAASTNVRLSGILNFRITGGAPPYAVTSSDSAIATPAPLIVDASGVSFNVQGNSVGTTLVTVSGQDGQQASIVFTTLP